MKNKNRKTLRVLKSLFAQRTGPYTRAGLPLTAEDSLIVDDAYIQFICLTFELDYLDLDKRKADTVRLIKDLLRSDIMVVLKALAELYGLCQIRTNRGFKALCRNVACNFHAIVKADFNAMVSGDIESARRLIQLTAYLNRMSLKQIDLKDQCLNDYMETEECMIDLFPTSIISSLRQIIQKWVADFNPADMLFKHGPGGVAGFGRTTLQNKYRNLNQDKLLYKVFGDSYVPFSTPKGYKLLSRVSQTVFVPKSYKTFRTISMEPAALMYLQQGVLSAFDDMVERNTYLRNRIGTHEQERNKHKAREGSIFRNFATIDLSAASDSVAWALVVQLFRGTELFPYLHATRSTSTRLPNKRVIRIKKFAPMGSALCFPIETMIFASICELVTRRWHNSSRERRFLGNFSVYGDDIIVPTECVADVMSVLQLLGFRVNKDKSFYDTECWYRESCGGEFINGVDVTPMRISRNYQYEYGGEEGVTGYADAANECFKRGFSLLRSFYLSKLVDHEIVSLFGGNGIHSYNDTNYHTRKRQQPPKWPKPDYQRPEYLVTTFVPEGKNWRKKYRGNPEIAYRHWLETNQRRTHVDEAFESNVGSLPPVKKVLSYRATAPSIDDSGGDKMFVEKRFIVENTRRYDVSPRTRQMRYLAWLLSKVPQQ